MRTLALVALVAVAALLVVGMVVSVSSAPSGAQPVSQAHPLCKSGDVGNATANGTIGVVVGPSPAPGCQ